MLVLTRRHGESIQIHTPDKHVINLTVTQLKKGQVKIGFDAPAYYSIVREELLPVADRTRT